MGYFRELLRKLVLDVFLIDKDIKFMDDLFLRLNSKFVLEFMVFIWYFGFEISVFLKVYVVCGKWG